MRRLAACLGVLVAVPLLLPSTAVGQKRPGQKKVKQEEATPQDYALIKKMKDITGTLTYFDATEKTATLRVEYQTYEPIPPKPGQRASQQMQNLLRQQQQLNQQYQQVLNARTAAQQQQRLQSFLSRYQQFQVQLAQAQAKAAGQFKTITHSKEIEFDLMPEVKVARAELPMEYDDKGKIKEYTKEERKKLRDPDMPGYTAKFEDLQPGQKVKFYLAKPKPAKKDPKKETTTDKKEGADGQKEGDTKKVEPETKKPADEPKKSTDEPKKSADEATKPGTKGDPGKAMPDTPPDRALVRMALIVAEADPAASTKDNPKRKKKTDE